MNNSWIYFLVLVPCAVLAGAAVFINLKNGSVRKEEETLLEDSLDPEQESEDATEASPKEVLFYEDPTVVSLKTARVEKLFKERTPNEKVMVKQLIKLGLDDPRSIDQFLNTIQSETAKEVPPGEVVHNRRSTDRKSRSDSPAPSHDHGTAVNSTGYTPSSSGSSGGSSSCSDNGSSGGDSGGGGCD